MSALTPKQNKRIAEWLGLCGNGDCLVLESRCCPLQFDSEKGFFKIIDHGPKQEWWPEFVRESPCFMCTYFQGGSWAIRQDYLGPALAVELARWLEEKEKKNG